MQAHSVVVFCFRLLIRGLSIYTYENHLPRYWRIHFYWLFKKL